MPYAHHSQKENKANNEGNENMEAPVRKIHSPTWNYFKRISSGLAKCDLCKKKLSYKTSITNLKRHLLLKHKVNLGYKITKPFTKLDNDISIKKLISLVRKQPCLWDTNSAFFNNPDNEMDAWNMIATALCPGMDLVIAVAKLSERFCSLKDQFLEERSLIANGVKLRKSVHYQDLLFLDPTAELITISSDSSVQEDAVEQSQMDIFEINEITVKDEPLDERSNEEQFHNITEEDSPQTAEIIPREQEENSLEWINESKYSVPKGSPPKETKNNESKANEKKNPPQYTLQLNNANRDVLFLLSLTEEMKRVPKEMKTQFKSDLMMTVSRLMQKYRRAGGDG